MAVELPDKLTAIDKKELIAAFWHAWGQYFGRYPPKRESIWVLIAQVWLETGLVKCHNFNMGNAKSRVGDGFDYQYFACNEILKLKQAEAMQAASPQTAKITTIRPDGTAIIWFYPKHPGCRFRAFTSLLDGVVDHLHLVANRYSKAWPYVIQGDPVEYSKALKRQGYYTADEAPYTKGLKGCFDAVAKEPFDYDALPLLTSQEVERVQNVVASSLARDLDLHADTFDDDLE